MAWNQPTNSAKKIEGMNSGGKRRLALYCSLAALVLLVTAAFVFFVDSRTLPLREREVKPNTKALKIVESAAASTNAQTSTERPSLPSNSLPKLKPGEKRHVTWTKPDNWDQMTPAQRTRYQPVGRVIKPKWMNEKRLFAKLTDEKINRLLRIRPGQMFIGTATYDERFVKDFVDSLKTPIEFSEDDTEEDRAAKQAVIDTRTELKEAYDRGEDIAAIMRETEKSMHEQAAYRVNLQREIVKYRQSGEHSDQDVQDYIDAANTILKEHGMEPLKLKQFWYHKAMMDAKEAKQ